MIKKWINTLLRPTRHQLVKIGASAEDELKHNKAFWEIVEQCRPYTMTSVERMYALYQAVHYVLDQNLPGALVECGVWRGGSAMLIALTLRQRKVTNRHLYLYDTFEGMSAPTKNDFNFKGQQADTLLEQNKDNKETSVWCLADLNEVQHNMGTTQYPSEYIHYVQGKVEDTIPSRIPAEPIALLRLDTDWYESTHHELVHLYPQLIQQGVLIIDDYGHWEGCRKAVDEYFAEHQIHLLLQRIDYTGRMAINALSSSVRAI